MSDVVRVFAPETQKENNIPQPDSPGVRTFAPEVETTAVREFAPVDEKSISTHIGPIDAPESKPLEGEISFDELKQALIWAENKGQTEGVSPKGALGLMQIMPTTGQEVAKKIGIQWDVNRLAHDREYNELLGTKYLRDLWDQYEGNPSMAAAAYNAGPGGLKRALAQSDQSGKHWIDHVPEETSNYLHTILQRIAKARAELPDVGKAGKAAVNEVVLGVKAIPSTVKTIGRELLYGTAPEVSLEDVENPVAASIIGPNDKPSTQFKEALKEQEAVAKLQGAPLSMEVTPFVEPNSQVVQEALAQGKERVFLPHQLAGALPDVQDQYEADRAEMLDFVRRKVAMEQALTPAEREIKNLLSVGFMVGVGAAGGPLAGTAALGTIVGPQIGLGLAEKRSQGISPLQALGETGIEQGIQIAPMGMATGLAVKGAPLVKQATESALGFGAGRAAGTAFAERNTDTPKSNLLSEFVMGATSGALVGGFGYGAGKARKALEKPVRDWKNADYAINNPQGIALAKQLYEVLGRNHPLEEINRQLVHEFSGMTGELDPVSLQPTLAPALDHAKIKSLKEAKRWLEEQPEKTEFLKQNIAPWKNWGKKTGWDLTQSPWVFTTFGDNHEITAYDVLYQPLTKADNVIERALTPPEKTKPVEETTVPVPARRSLADTSLWGKTIPFEKAPIEDQVAAEYKSYYGVEKAIKIIEEQLTYVEMSDLPKDKIPAYKAAIENLKHMPSSIPTMKGDALIYPTAAEVYTADIKPKIYQTVIEGFEIPEERKPLVQASAEAMELAEAPAPTQKAFKDAVEDGAWVFTPEMVKGSFWEKYHNPETGTIGIPWGLANPLGSHDLWKAVTSSIYYNDGKPTRSAINLEKWTGQVNYKGYVDEGNAIFEKAIPAAIDTYKKVQEAMDKYYPDEDYIPVYYGHKVAETPYWLTNHMFGENTEHKYLNVGLSPKVSHGFGDYHLNNSKPINSIIFVPKKNVYGMSFTHSTEKELFIKLEGAHYVGELPAKIDEYLANTHDYQYSVQGIGVMSMPEVLIGNHLHMFEPLSKPGEKPVHQAIIPGILPKGVYKEEVHPSVSAVRRIEDWVSGDMFAGETHKILLQHWEQQIQNLKGHNNLTPESTIGTTPKSGFVTYPNGTKAYLKILEGDRLLQGFTEYLANRLYGALGRNVLVQGIKPTTSAGKKQSVLLSQPQKLTAFTKKDWRKLTPEQRAEIYKGFAVDAWLANWDGLDLGSKNVQLDGKGRPIRTDNGGTILFRAQGGLKENFGASVEELHTLKDPSIFSAAVFYKDIPPHLELESAKALAALSNEEITQIISDAAKQAKVSAAYRNKVTKLLLARKQFIMEHYGLGMNEDVKLPLKVEIAKGTLKTLQLAGGMPPMMIATAWMPHLEAFWQGKSVHQVISLGGNLNQQMQAHLANSKYFNSVEQASVLLSMTRFNAWAKWGQSVLANLDANSHIPAVVAFRGGLERMATTRSELVTSFDDLMQTIYNKVPRKEMRGLGEYLRDLDDKVYLMPGEKIRWPTPAEKQSLAAKWNISAKTLSIADAIQQRFLKALDEMQEVWEDNAYRKFGTNQQKLQEKLAIIQERMDGYRKGPYFPAMRFGDYGLTVKSNNPGGETTTVAFYAGSLAEMEKLQKQLRVGFPEGMYSIGVAKQLTADQQFYRAMPREFLMDVVVQEMKDSGMPLTKQQEELLSDIGFEALPMQSILQNYRKKNRTEGASDDWVRQIASYGTRHASHISRLVGNPILDGALRDLKQWAFEASDITQSFKETGGKPANRQVTKTLQLYEDLQNLRDYLSNPQTDFEHVKGLVHFFTLAFSPAQMLQEMSSLPLVAAPQMGATFGYSKATKTILNALTQPRKELLNGGLGKADPILAKAVEKAREDQLLVESQTSEAVALANGNLMSRALPGSWAMRAWRNTQWAGAFLQRTGSTFSREVTFKAAFSLARDALTDFQGQWPKTKAWLTHVSEVHGPLIQSLIQEQNWAHPDALAYAAAKELVENSHGNFQKMYRAASLRGGLRSTILLYKNFAIQRLWSLNPLAHPDYISVEKDPSTGSWIKKQTTNPLKEAAFVALGMQAFAAGLLGLPGAEDLKKFYGVLAKTWGESRDLDEMLKTYLNGFDLPLSANSMLHGMSHSLGGLFDLSNSFGMGNIVPFDPGDVAQVISGQQGLSGYEAIGRLGKDFGGVGAAWLYNLVDTLQNDNADWAKRLSETAPKFLKGPLATASAIKSGMETTLAGKPLINYDLTQPTAWAELTGRTLGLTPKRLSEARSALMMEKNAEQFWQTKSHEILQMLGRSVLHGDDELWDDGMKEWDWMLKNVPDRFLGHLPKSDVIKNSVKQYVLTHEDADYIPRADILAKEYYQGLEKEASLPHGGKVLREKAPSGR